jgi:hypothetical protein
MLWTAPQPARKWQGRRWGDPPDVDFSWKRDPAAECDQRLISALPSRRGPLLSRDRHQNPGCARPNELIESVTRNVRPILTSSTTLLVSSDEGVESSPNLLRCICRFMARIGPPGMPAVRSLSGVKRTLRGCGKIDVNDPQRSSALGYRQVADRFHRDTA